MADQIALSPRAWTELLLLSVIWGASFLSIRIALDEVGVATAVAHRVGWAALILWVIVWAKGLTVPRKPRIWGAFLVMGVLNNVLPFSLMAWGQLHIETGLTSILNTATAIFGVIVAALVFADERLTLRRVFGVGLGFLGAATAIGIDDLQSFDIRSLAQLAVLAGTLSYALAGAWARKSFGGLHPLVAAAGMLSAASLIMIPAAWSLEGPLRLALSPRTLAAIAYCAVIATALAYLLYYRVLAMAGSGNLMLCTLLIPPVAILLGVVVLSETLPPSAYLGFGILGAGLLILNHKPKRPLPKADAAR